MNEDYGSICLTCGEPVTFKKDTKKCRTCHAEGRYLPTPEEISIQCKEIRANNAVEMIKKPAIDAKPSSMKIRQYKIVDDENFIESFTF